MQASGKDGSLNPSESSSCCVKIVTTNGFYTSMFLPGYGDIFEMLQVRMVFSCHQIPKHLLKGYYKI